MSDTLSVHVGDHQVSGRRLPAASGRGPLIVAIHGGGFTSQYFDAGRFSLLDAAHAQGAGALALDRPGYGGSTRIAEGPRGIARGADVLKAAIDRIWQERSGDADGIVLVGHSIGSIAAMYIAADRPEWLRGIAISGVGIGLPPAPPFWNDRAPEEWVETPAEYRRSLMFGAPATYDADGPDLSNAAAEAVWWRELLESYTTWIDDGPGVTAAIRVPVHIRQGDADILFPQGAEEVERFAARFTSAPSVDAAVVADSGHCIDFHRAGAELHREQLAFAQSVGARAAR